MKDEITLLNRIMLLKVLHTIMLNMNDEEAYYHWTAIAVPDAFSEEDLEDIAEDDDEFQYVLRMFCAIFLQYCDAE